MTMPPRDDVKMRVRAWLCTSYRLQRSTGWLRPLSKATSGLEGIHRPAVNPRAALARSTPSSLPAPFETKITGDALPFFEPECDIMKRPQPQPAGVVDRNLVL